MLFSTFWLKTTCIFTTGNEPSYSSFFLTKCQN